MTPAKFEPTDLTPHLAELRKIATDFAAEVCYCRDCRWWVSLVDGTWCDRCGYLIRGSW